MPQPFTVPLLLATAGLSACAQMGAIKIQRSLQPSSPLMLFVAFTIICLLIFDWQTNHTPLAWPIENNWFVPVVVAVGAVALTATVRYHRTPAGRDLMLGAHQRWAISHWQPPRREWKRQELILTCLAWIPVYALPLSTIGVLASTIFKDVTIAIMVARAVGPAGTARLVGLAATISYMRVAVAFIFINSWASFLTDLCVIVALLVWLRQKSSRSPWEEAHVH